MLDRFPKTNYTKDRKGWQREVAETVAQSCERAGLPVPAFVHVGTTSFYEGIPRAFAKTRTLRPQRQDATVNAPLGDGFPRMPSRPGKPSRPQVHIWIKFEQQVQGPVILGAGRFLGYGLCKPLQTQRMSTTNAGTSQR